MCASSAGLSCCVKSTKRLPRLVGRTTDRLPALIGSESSGLSGSLNSSAGGSVFTAQSPAQAIVPADTNAKQTKIHSIGRRLNRNMAELRVVDGEKVLGIWLWMEKLPATKWCHAHVRSAIPKVSRQPARSKLPKMTA